MDKTYNVTPTDTAGPEISIFIIEERGKGHHFILIGAPNLSTHLDPI